MPEDNNTTSRTHIDKKSNKTITILMIMLIVLVGLDLLSLGWRCFFTAKSTSKTDISTATNNSSATNSLSVKKSTTSGWKTFTDTQHKFSLDFPEDWTEAATDTFVFVSKGDTLIQFTYADPGVGDIAVTKKETITINKQAVEFDYFIPKDETVKLYAIAKYGIKVQGQQNGYTVLFTINNKNSADTTVIKQILTTFKFI